MPPSVRSDGSLVPEWDRPEPYFSIPDALAKRHPFLRSKPRRVLPDDKSMPVHRQPRADRQLVDVHPNAIAVGSPLGHSSRDVWAWLMLAISGLGAIQTAIWTWNAFARETVTAVHMVFGSFFAGVTVLAALTAWWAYRAVVSMPPDWPILFDRANRTVSFFPPRTPPFFAFWRPAVTHAVTLPWDTVRARVYRTTQFTGRTFRVVYELMLQWAEDGPDKATLKCFVAIGDNGWGDDHDRLQLWEHVRRYMEETGPPILPGERLRTPANDRPPLAFPAEAIDAAGGPPLARDAVEALAQRR